MKKKVFILAFIILLTTGCTCEYNLMVDDSTFKESISLIASTTSDVSALNKKWEIPVDKDDYYLGDSDVQSGVTQDIYKYSFSNNTLTFTNDFTRKDYMNSTAAALCFKSITATRLSDQTLLSTSKGANCFDTYPELDKLTININVDREVVSNNADSVDGNKYTWVFTKNNAKNKSINISFLTDDDSDNVAEYDKNKYLIYIFLGILLMIVLGIYLTIRKIKKSDGEMDD